MNPCEEGFALEELIHNAALNIPNVKSLRENEIKAHFEDNSLNGVDHWLQNDATHVFIQDKWKESTNQHEVSQFIVCADRIMSRINGQKFFLIWAAKKEPTANSLKSLRERNVTIIHSNISIKALAKIVILQICECLGVDSTQALQSIPQVKPVETKPITTFVRNADYDSQEEGQKKISEMKELISQIQLSVLKKVENAQNMDGPAETYPLLHHFPKTERWEHFPKIDFNAFLKAAKPVCFPSKNKKLQSRSLFFYVKLRKLSCELSKYVNEYELRRKELLLKKSNWGKLLPQLKSQPEPIAEEEFKTAVSNCEDYWVNTLFSGAPKKIPNRTLLDAFHSHKCVLY